MKKMLISVLAMFSLLSCRTENDCREYIIEHADQIAYDTTDNHGEYKCNESKSEYYE